MHIRPAIAADAERFASIYAPYVRDTCISFETDAPDAGAMAARLADTQASGLPWLVLEAAGRVAGYAYASKWKGRCAYRYSVETTVYLDAAERGRGFGRALYARLLEGLVRDGFRTAIGGIALPNDASIGLHEALGFTKVAHFAEVGFKQARWVDVGYWQRHLSPG
jgi:phosphinothricin acetyltransferase